VNIGVQCSHGANIGLRTRHSIADEYIIESRFVIEL